MKTQTLSDLCCCVNAFDSYCMSFTGEEYKRGAETWRRQRRALVRTVLAEAQRLRDLGAGLKSLDGALRRGGWDDNRAVIGKNGRVEIVYV